MYLNAHAHIVAAIMAVIAIPACTRDLDLDGFDAADHGGSDCNDDDGFVSPGAAELCGDNIDNNCDGHVDDVGIDGPSWYVDNDGDGYGSTLIEAVALPCDESEVWRGMAPNDRDCNDADAEVHPGAPEICDGVDNDCTNIVDDGVVSVGAEPYDSLTEALAHGAVAKVVDVCPGYHDLPDVTLANAHTLVLRGHPTNKPTPTKDCSPAYRTHSPGDVAIQGGEIEFSGHDASLGLQDLFLNGTSIQVPQDGQTRHGVRVDLDNVVYNNQARFELSGVSNLRLSIARSQLEAFGVNQLNRSQLTIGPHTLISNPQGVSLGVAIGVEGHNDVHIHCTTIEDSAINGLFIWNNGSSVRVEDTTIRGSRLSGIYLRTNTQGLPPGPGVAWAFDQVDILDNDGWSLDLAAAGDVPLVGGTIQGNGDGGISLGEHTVIHAKNTFFRENPCTISSITTGTCLLGETNGLHTFEFPLASN